MLMIVWGLTNISQLWDWIEGGHHLSKGFLSPQIIIAQHCQKPQSNASSYIAEKSPLPLKIFNSRFVKNALSLTSFFLALQEHNLEMSSKSTFHNHHHHNLLDHHPGLAQCDEDARFESHGAGDHWLDEQYIQEYIEIYIISILIRN